MSEVTVLSVAAHRDFLTRVQNSLLEKAKKYRLQAEERGTPALVERAAIYQEISDIIASWKP